MRKKRKIERIMKEANKLTRKNIEIWRKKEEVEEIYVDERQMPE
jgi:hypothetical protein